MDSGAWNRSLEPDSRAYRRCGQQRAPSFWREPGSYPGDRV